MLLNRVEELLLGSPRELRPALAVCDPLVALDDGLAAIAVRHL
jgi:hypothetical protein